MRGLSTFALLLTSRAARLSLSSATRAVECALRLSVGGPVAPPPSAATLPTPGAIAFTDPGLDSVRRSEGAQLSPMLQQSSSAGAHGPAGEPGPSRTVRPDHAAWQGVGTSQSNGAARSQSSKVCVRLPCLPRRAAQSHPQCSHPSSPRAQPLVLDLTLGISDESDMSDIEVTVTPRSKPALRATLVRRSPAQVPRDGPASLSPLPRLRHAVEEFDTPLPTLKRNHSSEVEDAQKRARGTPSTSATPRDKRHSPVHLPSPPVSKGVAGSSGTASAGPRKVRSASNYERARGRGLTDAARRPSSSPRLLPAPMHSKSLPRSTGRLLRFRTARHEQKACHGHLPLPPRPCPLALYPAVRPTARPPRASRSVATRAEFHRSRRPSQSPSQPPPSLSSFRSRRAPCSPGRTHASTPLRHPGRATGPRARG